MNSGTEENYRILRHGDGFLALHRVCFDEHGKPLAYTDNAADFSAGTDKGLRKLRASVRRAAESARRPVLNASDFPFVDFELEIDADVLAAHQAMGPDWRERMIAVITTAFRSPAYREMADDDAPGVADLRILTELQNMLGEMKRNDEEREKNAFIQNVRFDEDGSMTFVLVDGRRIAVPLALFPRLEQATPEQRRHWKRDCCGSGILWPDLGERVEAWDLLSTMPLPQVLAWRRRVDGGTL